MNFNSNRSMVIDAYGVEWLFWNCKCPVCGNKYLRNPNRFGTAKCAFDEGILIEIEPHWTTNGYMPKENKFFYELKQNKEVKTK